MPGGTRSEEARISKQSSAPGQGTTGGGGEWVSLAATVSLADQERPWPVQVNSVPPWARLARVTSAKTVASARGKESEPRCSVRSPVRPPGGG